MRRTAARPSSVEEQAMAMALLRHLHGHTPSKGVEARRPARSQPL